jgi:demethylmenaquinone methyltransferase/2-methoxy-6-polyprenyl-1,4-benzoquinol methylase
MARPSPPHPVLKTYYETEHDRESFVTALFDGAARHYERIGQILDLGSGPTYRRYALVRAGLRPGMKLLDVATGTGLMARGGRRVVGAAGRVVGIDPSRGMLGEARKALAGSLVQGRAEALPFRDAQFDMLSMCFALRHVADLEVAFREYRRVLKPGGRLLLVEVSRPESATTRWLIRVYFQRVLPRIMRISTGNRPAELLMKYFWDTIDQCVPPEVILEVARASGFTAARRRVFAGFLSEYVGVKGDSRP